MKTKKMNSRIRRILANRYVQLGGVALISLFLGWLLFHTPSREKEPENLVTEQGKTTIWTCAMHPQIRMDHPGKCPICGMDLIPLTKDSGNIEPGSVSLTPDAAQLANVETSVVSRQQPVKEVRLYGKVQADERLLQSQVSHISGRIDKLMVNFTGEAVRKGQTIALVYSPELVNAQQELLEAAKTKESQPGIYEAAREKLKLWKLTEDQITGIEKSGKIRTDFEIVSNTDGIVTARRVNAGDHVDEGTVLFDIADLSDVWIMFDAYESDLPFLKTGDKLDFTLQAIPGKVFHGTIMFIDPSVDPVTRVTHVRVEVPNSSMELKPEMFATGIVRAKLDRSRDKLVIPRSAVLWTGERSIVYVKQPGTNEPVFKLREIDLGPMLGNSYVVESGLQDGEEIVTRGTFSVDASAQLEGLPSMMNPEGGKVSSMPGMNMPGMDMPAAGKPVPEANKEAAVKPMTDMTGHAQFHVSGNCDLCKERIEKAALSVDGVRSANWNETSREISVEYDEMKTNPDKIQAAIAKAGHDTEKFRADDKVYNALPECCKYRK